MLRELRRWRLALFAMFALPGMAFASWVTRTPAIRDSLHASTAEMGVVLLGLSTGAMTGILASPRLVLRLGGRPVIALGAVLQFSGVVGVAVAATAGFAPGVFCGLALFGAGTGAAEIAVNIEGAAVERALGRPVLPALHGCYSAGTFVGAVAGIALNSARVPIAVHLPVAAGVLAAGALVVLPWIPAGTGAHSVDPGNRPKVPKPSVWTERRVQLIAVIVLGMALAEGSAGDWLPLIAVDGFDMDASSGSVIYAVFALAMAIGRIGCGTLLHRFGRAGVMRSSAMMAAVGVLTVVLAPSAGPAGVGVLLWGLGASLGFPVGVSAAGDDPVGAAQRVSAVATAGYVAFLVGPPLLGVVGQQVGLRPAMLIVAAAVVAAGLAAPATRPVRT